jgi:uncharacterized membrane protein YidH (DUF202 family)
MTAPKCPSSSFDIRATAGFYSTVAGVMAGFAFAALFYFITSQTSPRSNVATGPDAHTTDRRDLAAQALGAAFGTLLLSSITYAVLAGEPKSAGRAATIEVVAGVGFAVGAIHLFYAIVLMIRAHQQVGSNLERYFQNLGGLFLCPLASLMIDLGVSDWEETKHHDRTAEIAYHAGLLISLAVAVICIMVAIWRRKDHNRTFPRFFNPAYWAIAVGGTAIVGTSSISVFLEECTPAAPGVMYLLMIATAVVLVNQSLWFYWPPEKFQSLRRS